MGAWFDELARALARGESRREALRRLGAIAAGGVLAALAPGRAVAAGLNCTDYCSGQTPGLKREICLRACCDTSRRCIAFCEQQPAVAQEACLSRCPFCCIPTTCAEQGKSCGTIPDNCGG